MGQLINEFDNNNYINEVKIGGIPSITKEKNKIIISQLEKNICKIYTKNDQVATGFYCKIQFPDQFHLFPALITNNHVINKQSLIMDKNIKITIDDDNINKNIKINNSRKTFIDEEIDITIIEIKPELDEINNFLEIDENIYDNNYEKIYENKEIYILQYQDGQKSSFSLGTVKRIYEKNIQHICSTEFCSSGSPILNLSNYKVIGVHKRRTNFNYNEGTFIKFVIDEFNKINNLNNNIKENDIFYQDNFIVFNNRYIKTQYKNDKSDSNYNNNQFNSNSKIIVDEEINKIFQKYPPLNDKIPVELKPMVEFENGEIYYGEWEKNGNIRHGRGIQILKDGTRYEGYWKGDKANIRGKLIYSDGGIYEGELENDKPNGYGVYIHCDGHKYEGFWKEDKQEGKGKEIWPDGASFEGDYKQGKKSGFGKFKWADGSVYEGQFENNNINGKGTYIFNDKRQYKGNWKNNKFEGYGIFTWPDGRKYEGDYKDDKKNGFGIFECPNGKKYKGYLLNGKQHGEGELFNNKTKVWRKGLFQNGKIIKWIDD